MFVLRHRATRKYICTKEKDGRSISCEGVRDKKDATAFKTKHRALIALVRLKGRYIASKKYQIIAL